jgi:protein-disulfide isomerase
MKVEELAMTAASTLLTPPVTSRDHVRGPASAAITLVEYGGYACPHCKEARFVVSQLQAALGDRLRYIFRNLPMSTLHPNPHNAAEAAEASGAQSKFWEMHDFLYDHQPAFSDKQLKGYATQVGLDMERFNRDMTLHTYAFRVGQDILSARQSGVSDTPAFFINNSRYLGFCEFEMLLFHMEEVT